MTDVPGEWLTVPPGTEYVEPEIDTRNRRANLSYNDNDMTTATGTANRGGLASDPDIGGVLFSSAGEECIPDGFGPAVFGSGAYGMAECIRPRSLLFDPEVLPGVTRPPDAFAFEWETDGTTIAYELREYADAPTEGIVISGFTRAREGGDPPVPPSLNGYLHLGLVPGGAITTTPNPAAGDPNRETAVGPRPDAFMLPLLSTVTVPAGGSSVDLFLPRMQVAFSGGEWLTLAATTDWARDQLYAGLPRIVGAAGFGAFDVHCVIGDPWPRYRWIYPPGGPSAPRYGWGVLLG